MLSRSCIFFYRPSYYSARYISQHLENNLCRENILKTISNSCPLFPISPKNITILSSPPEFYQYILKKISTSQHEIYLASLYVGTDEKELVQALANALSFVQI